VTSRRAGFRNGPTAHWGWSDGLRSTPGQGGRRSAIPIPGHQVTSYLQYCYAVDYAVAPSGYPSAGRSHCRHRGGVSGNTLAIQSGTLPYGARETVVSTSPLPLTPFAHFANHTSLMKALLRGICIGLLVAALPQLATAQEIPKSEYIEYEPLASPRIVGQTRASAAWHLFGDPADPTYRDVSPRDGIDDKRHDLLLGLAVRFAPTWCGTRRTSPWTSRGSSPVGHRFRCMSIPGRCHRAGTPFANGHRRFRRPRTGTVRWCVRCTQCGATVRSARRLSVARPAASLRSGRVRCGHGGPYAGGAEQELVHIFYFDFPGQDAGSWKAEFENLVSGELPRRYETFAKVYAHPFIHEVADGAQVGAAYEFVLQYWFFYPYNDSGNKHEGDWEHVNVVAGLRDHPVRP